jgi:hypothetical protein
VITLWQLVPLLPLSYALGLGISPEERTLFASGALLLVAAVYAVDRLPLRVTPTRLAAFAVLVILAWLAASWQLQPSNDLVVRDELFVLVPVAVVVGLTFLQNHESALSRPAVYLTALLPIVVGWGLFNPLQSTRVMFRTPKSEVTRELDALAARRSDGALAVPGFTGAILNGVGYRSVTHVIAVPNPGLFRKYFPDMDPETFNEVFNRYAHIGLTRRKKPFSPQNDLILVPVKTMSAWATSGNVQVPQRTSTAPIPSNRGSRSMPSSPPN